MLGRRIAQHGLTMVATALLGGLLSATFVRLAPGFDADESSLDPHLSSQSIQALREDRAEHHHVLTFYVRSLHLALHGDLGTSISLKQPVSTLLHNRIPLTFKVVALGLLMSWAGVLTLALSAASARTPAYDLLATATAGLLLCVPAAVLALLSVLWNLGGALAIALIIFPRDYRYTRNLLGKAYSLPHII